MMHLRYVAVIVLSSAAFFATNLRAQEFATDVYRVGPDDVLEISVQDNPDLKTIATVTFDGNISFPFIGTIYVKGKAISEIKDTIRRRLSEGYIKFPVVTVSLLRSLSKKIFVYGELMRVGQFPYESGMTVLRALSIAGGSNKNGEFGKIKLKRKIEGEEGYKEINIGLISTVKNSTKSDMILLPDDILILEKNETFLIQGEVKQRGRFSLEKDMTTLNALLQAGGVTEQGLYGRLKVRRKQEGKQGHYKDIAESRLDEGRIESKDVEDLLLRPDDILIIEKSKTILIEGEVASRGRFVLEKDMTTLNALLQAGGVTEQGLYGRLKVRRKQEGNQGIYKDIAESKLDEGRIEGKEVEDLLLQPDDIIVVERGQTFLIQGAVVNRGLFVLKNDMSVLSALLEAGGVNDNGMYGKIKVRRRTGEDQGGYLDVIESNLNSGIVENSRVEEMILQPDDIIVVEQSQTFFIYGESNKVGEFVLERNMTVFKALTIAGGFTKWGSESRVKILRLNDDGSGFLNIKVDIAKVLDGDVAADVKLEAADIVVVSAGLF